LFRTIEGQILVAHFAPSELAELCEIKVVDESVETDGTVYREVTLERFFVEECHFGLGVCENCVVEVEVFDVSVQKDRVVRNDVRF
jgi:hypothetical protein